jgi:hypothetical protein
MSASRSALPIEIILAVGATGTAVCLSVLAGWQRGGSLPERLVWVAMGVVLVLSAHLLPALVRTASFHVRCVATALWAASMATACYGHATFFILAQQHAGSARAAAVTTTVTPRTSGRNLTAVMAERAKVIHQLALTGVVRCAHDCRVLETRRVTLAALLDELDAEAAEVRRSQDADDRVAAQREALLTDPVTTRLAGLLGITTPRVDLLSGLAFAAVLEGIACLLWAVALGPRLPVADTSNVLATVVPGHEVASDDHALPTGPVASTPVVAPPADDELDQLQRDVAAGRVRVTVADIRRHLGCSQARATALRRQIAGLNPGPNPPA